MLIAHTRLSVRPQVMLTGPAGATEYPNRTVAFAVEGFDRLALSRSWPFIELVMSPKILALAKKGQPEL